jgi:DNA-binding NarL/FixJ family response regulator
MSAALQAGSWVHGRAGARVPGGARGSVQTEMELAFARPASAARRCWIAPGVRDGLSNPEIAAQLFLFARTVEWHPRKIFTKLGISSRRELREALSARADSRGPDAAFRSVKRFS